MRKIIAGSAARLEFAIVDGTTGAAIADADETAISTAKYQTIGPNGQRSALSADVGTLTAVASTASVIAGSFGAIDASQGLYFIDFPALAALDSAYSVEAVIELVSGDNVARPVVHEIDAKVSTRATPANVTDARDVITALLPAALVSGRMDVSVGSMAANTLTASALAADAGAEIYAAFGTGSNLTALATQTSVNDIPTNAEFAAAFPLNFASLGINGSGHVSRVTLVDTTTANTDMRGTDSALTTKTGFALSATGLDLVTAWTTDITGSLSGNVGGIAGTINTLDQLDTAQDEQHSTTRTAVDDAFTVIKGATWSGTTDTLEAIRDRGDVAWITEAGGGGSSSGIGFFTIQLEIKLSNGNLVPECDCVLTTSNTDSSTDIHGNARSDANAIAEFGCDEGTYYLWRQKSGINFNNPRIVTVASNGDVTVTGA